VFIEGLGGNALAAHFGQGGANSLKEALQLFIRHARQAIADRQNQFTGRQEVTQTRESN
jgi:hypothetical protein